MAAARCRAKTTPKRAVWTLRRMDKAGLPITFDAVAREARVSRSWLYNQPELCSEIERLRARRHLPTQHMPVPDRQRASNSSRLQRLKAATERINHLEEENTRHRQALALALGEQRAKAVHGEHRDTLRRKPTALIGPC
ncbi:DUF6262 family protein [Mycobacterium xenopi]|uniref:DUF6262 family protein n=1 Tax=Mycobacterium xenopi TaxID=1789 RepID=UPI0022EA4F7C|nr:DUF6262 family protein [Mycobacterium xenopi]MDA3641884.1 DUF6262 family protein [Mycobacterium xenopi]MDA3658748.1 DUF6262 family protein [Mycobacterium xenopi]MDA3664157.1 DUF6262 family protein [Mycobacterium xenopi]